MNGSNGPAANRSTPSTIAGPVVGVVSTKARHTPGAGSRSGVRQVPSGSMVGSRRWKPAASRRMTTACSGPGSRGVGVNAVTGRPSGPITVNRSSLGGARRRTWGRPPRAGSPRRRRRARRWRSRRRGRRGRRVVVAAGVATAGGASGAGRTSPPANQATANTRTSAQGVRRQPCCDPHARHLRPPCSTARPCPELCFSLRSYHRGVYPARRWRRRARWSCSKGDHAVVARRSPARHARVTPPSRHGDRPPVPTRRPCRPSTPTPARGPAGRSPRAA